mmetsp:Transcript_1402/g.3616  ORF Transcript_1402/g.3616 Transcript_1402/m.3616 type:complete len:249 (-) Transcript_1402:549-1295(-)
MLGWTARLWTYARISSWKGRYVCRSSCAARLSSACHSGARERARYDAPGEWRRRPGYLLRLHTPPTSAACSRRRTVYPHAATSRARAQPTAPAPTTHRSYRSARARRSGASARGEGWGAPTCSRWRRASGSGSIAQTAAPSSGTSPHAHVRSSPSGSRCACRPLATSTATTASPSETRRKPAWHAASKGRAKPAYSRRSSPAGTEKTRMRLAATSTHMMPSGCGRTAHGSTRASGSRGGSGVNQSLGL